MTECERALAAANARIVALRATLMETHRLMREMQKDVDFVIHANSGNNSSFQIQQTQLPKRRKSKPMPTIATREFNPLWMFRCFLDYTPSVGPKYPDELEIVQPSLDLRVPLSPSNCTFTSVPGNHDAVEIVAQGTLNTGEQVQVVANIRETMISPGAKTGKGEMEWVVTRKSDGATVMDSSGWKKSNFAVIVTP